MEVIWREELLTRLVLLSGLWVAGAACLQMWRVGIWTWDKGFGCHDVISLLGSDYHFNCNCADSVCKGSSGGLWKTSVDCVYYWKRLMLNYKSFQWELQNPLSRKYEKVKRQLISRAGEQRTLGSNKRIEVSTWLWWVFSHHKGFDTKYRLGFFIQDCIEVSETESRNSEQVE